MRGLIAAAALAAVLAAAAVPSAQDAPAPGAAPANTTPATAQPIGLDGRAEAIVERNEYGNAVSRYYLLEIDAASAEARFDVVVANPSNARLNLEYVDANDYGIGRADRAENGELRLRSYVLGQGRHMLRVSAQLEEGDPLPSFTLSFERKGVWRPGEEREPNSDIKLETAAPVAAGMNGEISGEDDRDYFALDVTGPLQLWTVEAKGAAVGGLILTDAGGSDIKRASVPSEGGTTQLWSVLLPPGLAHFRIAADPGPWEVTATPQGPAPIEVLGGSAAPRKPGETDEVEPNDGKDRALILPMGGSRSGQIETGEDIDVYRFTLDGETRVRLTLSGPADLRLRSILTRVNSSWEAGRLVVAPPPEAEGPAAPADASASADYLLPQGDYYVEIKGDRREKRPYELALERLAYYGPAADLEPNDDVLTAKPVPASLRLQGTLLADDVDWYRLPDLDRPSTLTVTAAAAPRDLELRVGILAIEQRANGPQRWSANDGDGRLQRAEDGKTYTIELPAGRDRYLRLVGGPPGPYDLQLAFGDGPKPVPPEDSLTATLSADAPAIAAFSGWAQRLHAKLTVKNAGGAAAEATLRFHLSDDRWSIEGAPETLSVAAGASAEAEVTLIAPAMLQAGGAVIVSAEARAGGAAAAAETSIGVDNDAAPVAPEHRWPLPDAMLGGINVAWRALGGSAPDSAARLIDGFATSGTAERIDGSDDPADIAVLDLAGDAPLNLTGVTVNTTIGPEMNNQVRRIAIETSADGVAYTRQFEGDVGYRQREYVIPFAAPVAAKYVKVLPLLPQGISYATPEIGEVKAFAEPGVAAALAPQGFNIADPLLGGFVVDFAPSDVEFNQILTGAESPPEARIETEAPRTVFWTVGFRDRRAARIARVEWTDRTGLDPEKAIARVTVETAMDARGPYAKAGVWELTRGPDGTIAPFVFPSPLWARYVRFTAEVPPPRENSWAVYLALPQKLAIFEALPGPDGGTIVGEWGEGNPEGPYERLNPAPPPQTAAAMAAGGASRDEARPLPPDEARPGRVSAGTRVDWWAIEVPAEGQSLTLTLDGTPSLGVVAALEDASGKAVPLVVSTDDGRTRIAAAKVAPGRYYLRVEEPPRSIAISWDTSGSVGPYVPTIIQSIRGFARFLTPGRDEVNMVPFRDPESVPLLETWTGDPLTAFSTLNAYNWADQSSNAESGLIGSLKALDGRPGTRAVILITDYATGKSTEMRMQAIGLLRKTGARVFNFAIPSGSETDGAIFERGLMLSFAGFSNGTATYAGTPSDLEQAFARTAAALRAPKDYTVTAAIGFKPPDPGTIEVAVPEAEDAPASKERAVLVILDASGSMLKKLGKKRRIEIAKDTLNELTQKMLPEGTPLAMRVFGDTKPDSCETNLRLPLAPLDRAAAKAVVDKIVSINKAKTAIAASLAAAASDLAEAKGQKLIVLITDGEETCDGDPAAEIAALREAGIDARVSIVGFAVDDAALKDTFAAWASAGGGGYFDATKPDELAPAVRRALLPPFEVVAADGTVVASGVAGGDPVAAPPGTYTVRVLSDPPREFTGVVVESGGAVRLTLGEDGR